jgi:chromosome segregation ATPase
MERACVEENVERVDALESYLSDLATSTAGLSAQLAQQYSSTKALAEAEAFSEEAVPQLLACLHHLQAENNGLKRELRRHREAAVAELTASISQVEAELEDLRKQVAKTDNEINVTEIDLSAATQRLSGLMIAERRTSELPINAQRQFTQALVSDPMLFAALTKLPTQSEVDRFLALMEQQSGPFSTRRALRVLL